jgi:CheY-like chemotaxis protein
MALVFIADPELAASIAADPICRSEAHELLHVGTSDQVLALAARRRPDLVILPETLPGGVPGPQCARTLRDQVGRHGTLIALVARQPSPAVMHQAAAAGCDRVLQAPASRDAVYQALKTVVPARTKQVRVPLDVLVEVSPGRQTATARDLSRHGMRLDLPDHLSAGARMDLTLQLPRFPTRFRVEAVVAWCRPTSDGTAVAGVRFENVGRLERQIIDAFIMTSRTALRV